MKLYSKDENYTLYSGNMLDMLEVIEPNSIDAIVTDPPYELNFMNKKWDSTGIAFQKETWKKCYDVLKSGGHMLAFASSRTQHRIACAIEDAGFEIRDTIMWLYGSGFPKSMDISKQIDKRGGNNTKFLCNLIKQKREEKNLSQKQLDELMNTNSMVNRWEKGERGITPIQFNKLCKILDLPYENIQEAERQIIGKKEKRMSGWDMDGSTKYVDRNITISSTDLAKQWNGWGTALKPSFEPIIVARKPFNGSLVDNIIENGVGGINIDECRVKMQEKDKEEYYQKRCSFNNMAGKVCGDNVKFNASPLQNLEDSTKNMELGRFPANTILTYDDSDYDEVCGGFPNSGNGNGKGAYSYKGVEYHNKDTSMFNGDKPQSPSNYNDNGSASRYFYCAKASKRDRNEGLDDFEERFQVNAEFRPNHMKKALEGDSGKPYGRYTPVKNFHPCVKPTSLMQYLVRLVTPKGGTVLDPFNGSGSTGKACMYENADRNANYKYIGIELTEEYLPIAKARIEFAEKNPIMDYEIKRVSQIKNDESATIFDL